VNPPRYFRPAYGQTALLLVPKIEHQQKWSTIIKGGSAIVGYLVDSETIHAYYEGNIYRFDNLQTYEERALCAYGRLCMVYGTVAQVGVPVAEFEIVGKLTPECFDLQSTPAVKAWRALDASMIEPLPVL